MNYTMDSDVALSHEPKTDNAYVVRAYKSGHEITTEVLAATAVDALHKIAGYRDFASLTSRWHMSSEEADRDNCQAQLDYAGVTGWAVRRAEVDPAAAEHRNDVEVARRWVADGLPLEKLQAHGGYSTVTEADLA